MTPDEYSAAVRQCLIELDATTMRKLHRQFAAHLYQPKDDHECLISLHYARTVNKTLRMRLRAYSHQWLISNGYPSGLPDRLRPRAQRLYPVGVEATVVGYRVRSPLFKPVQPLVQGAMVNAVMEMHGDGERDPLVIRARTLEAKDRELKKLIGCILIPDVKQ